MSGYHGAAELFRLIALALKKIGGYKNFCHVPFDDIKEAFAIDMCDSEFERVLEEIYFLRDPSRDINFIFRSYYINDTYLSYFPGKLFTLCYMENFSGSAICTLLAKDRNASIVQKIQAWIDDLCNGLHAIHHFSIVGTLPSQMNDVDKVFASLIFDNNLVSEFERIPPRMIEVAELIGVHNELTRLKYLSR